MTLRLLRQEPKSAEPVPHKPVALAPIPWGKPDSALANAVCAHMVEATPPIVIPANPFTTAKVRAFLRSHHVSHE